MNKHKKDKHLEVWDARVFDFLLDHAGHEFNCFWEGDEFPEVMILKCYCGDDLRIERGIENGEG